jgi:hypothetical protein
MPQLRFQFQKGSVPEGFMPNTTHHSRERVSAESLMARNAGFF